MALAPPSNPIIQELDKFFKDALNFETELFEDIAAIDAKTQK